MDKIAVLIPCYNEEKTIAKVIRDAKKALPEAVIYVYNNNSTDRTCEIAEAEGAVVRHEYMQGKGNVIRRMFREIEAQCYIMVDGDDTYPMEFAPEMVDKVLCHNADMVVGDRLSSTYFEENKRPFHNMGNSLVRGSINRLFGCDIKDIMTGFRAFSYGFVKTFPVLSKGFEIETEIITTCRLTMWWWNTGTGLKEVCPSLTLILTASGFWGQSSGFIGTISLLGFSVFLRWCWRLWQCFSLSLC